MELYFGDYSYVNQARCRGGGRRPLEKIRPLEILSPDFVHPNRYLHDICPPPLENEPPPLVSESGYGPDVSVPFLQDHLNEGVSDNGLRQFV